MSSISEHCRGTVLLVFLTALIKICFLTCCQTALQVRPDIRSQIFLDKLSFKRKFELSSLIGALSWVSLQSYAQVHGIWNSKTDLKIVSHNSLKDTLPGSMLFQLGLFTFVFPTFFPKIASYVSLHMKTSFSSCLLYKAWNKMNVNFFAFLNPENRNQKPKQQQADPRWATRSKRAVWLDDELWCGYCSVSSTLQRKWM